MSQDGSRTIALSKVVPPSRTGWWAFLASCALMILLVGLFMAMCLGLQVIAVFAIDPVIAVISAISAVTFGIPYLAVILWLDRNEKEPPHLLASAFLWGAVMACGISGIFNDLTGMVLLSAVGDQAIATQLTASFSAPFIEELSKGSAVLVIFLFFHRDFDNVLDGLIYGAVVGCGFGVFENFIYYVQEPDIPGVVVHTYLRGVMMGLGTHATWTGITGASLGLFRVMRKGCLRYTIPPLGLGLAMFSHFAWNTFQGLFVHQTQDGVTQLLVSFPAAVFFLQTPFVVLALCVSALALWHERRIIRKYLSSERPPVVMAGEIDALVPAWWRNLKMALLLVTFQPAAWWRQRRRNRKLVRLAFEKWHMDQEDLLDKEAQGHYHALRVSALRKQLRALVPPQPEAKT